MPDGTRVKTYRPAGPTLARFHASTARVRGIMGPIGSGKSTACVLELIRAAVSQPAGPDGKRRSRWAIVRNTQPELLNTTLKTWQEWAPTHLGRFVRSPPITHHLTFGDVDAEFLFLALDQEADVRKLMSLELTGGWVNEAREVPLPIIQNLNARLRRYPPKDQGGAAGGFLLLDTNPPDEDSWWHRFAEEETPERWAFFRQPSALSPDAENLDNLEADYYADLLGGQDEAWVHVMVEGEYGLIRSGKPVYPMFSQTLHVASEPLRPIPERPLVIGVDYGLTPAAVFVQRTVMGQWLIVDELVTSDTSVEEFGSMLTALHAERYRECREIRVWGDPAGEQRAQTNARTALEVLNAATGWMCRSAPTNDVAMRLEAVKGALHRLIAAGQPMLLVSPKCRSLIRGFVSGYVYERRGQAGGNRALYRDKPSKNEFSHIHDALQYAVLGEGGDRVVRGLVARPFERSGGARREPITMRTDFDVFADEPERQRSQRR